jgi:hypothetical protein
MTQNTEPLSDRLARYARYGLLIAIAVVGGMVLSSARTQGNPFTIRPAVAEGSVTAAPGYLILSMNTGGASKFYLADTTKQVLCVYEITGDKLRLTGARKFDVDANIFDGSLPGGGKYARGIEAGNGVTRDEAKEYGDAMTKMFEEYKSKTQK